MIKRIPQREALQGQIRESVERMRMEAYRNYQEVLDFEWDCLSTGELYRLSLRATQMEKRLEKLTYEMVDTRFRTDLRSWPKTRNRKVRRHEMRYGVEYLRPLGKND